MIVNVPPITHGRFTYKSNDSGMLRQTVCLSDLLDKPLEYYKDLEYSNICIVTNTFNTHHYEVYLPMFNIKFNTIWLDEIHQILYNAVDYLQLGRVYNHGECGICIYAPNGSNITHTHKMILACELYCMVCAGYISSKYYQLINGELHNTILCTNCKEFSDNMPAITYTKMKKESEYTIYCQDTSELKSIQPTRYSFDRIVPLMEYLPRDLVKFVYSILVLMPTITNLIL